MMSITLLCSKFYNATSCCKYLPVGSSMRWVKQEFCDEKGVPLTREQAGERLARELDLDRRMRMYHRHSDTQTCDTYLSSQFPTNHMHE